MEDTQTPTRAELDAMLEAQRASHIERLRRRANRSYFWLVALALPLLSIPLGYRFDQQWPSAFVIGSMLLMVALGVISFMMGRREAARQLSRELSQ